MRVLPKPLAGATLVVLAYIAIGGVVAAAVAPFKPRGEFIDIGGRKLRIVCMGPKTNAPTILFEPGAFGMAADFGAVQEKVTAQGFHSCSYDRAGMGWSDPGPQPRDGNAVVSDLEKLLAAAHEDGPFILVGHSMAGLYLRLYAGRNPEKVAGLVLVDAATPEASDVPRVQAFVKAFTKASKLASFGASAGLYWPLMGTRLGDKIGLPADAAAEKRRAFASAGHNRTAAAEVAQWPATSQQARAIGPYNPDWPVAVVTAGPSRVKALAGWKSLQAAPARLSHHGFYENVPEASHTTLLGEHYGEAVLRGIDHVRDAIAAAHAPAAKG